MRQHIYYSLMAQAGLQSLYQDDHDNLILTEDCFPPASEVEVTATNPRSNLLSILLAFITFNRIS